MYSFIDVFIETSQQPWVWIFLVLYQCDVNKHEVCNARKFSSCSSTLYTKISPSQVSSCSLIEQMGNEECKIEMNHLSSGQANSFLFLDTEYWEYDLNENVRVTGHLLFYKYKPSSTHDIKYPDCRILQSNGMQNTSVGSHDHLRAVLMTTLKKRDTDS